MAKTFKIYRVRVFSESSGKFMWDHYFASVKDAEFYIDVEHNYVKKNRCAEPEEFSVTSTKADFLRFLNDFTGLFPH